MFIFVSNKLVDKIGDTIGEMGEISKPLPNPGWLLEQTNPCTVPHIRL
jgi:hypothetical protein